MSGTFTSKVAMPSLLGGRAPARGAALGGWGTRRLFLGPATDRLVFRDAPLGVLGGVVARQRAPFGGRHRRGVVIHGIGGGGDAIGQQRRRRPLALQAEGRTQPQVALR